MNINNQTFPYEIVLPGLLQWFNSRPANQRVIQTNDVALFKVRIIEDSDGEYSFIVGPNPYEEPGTKYVLEATFLWCGPRGINLIAEPEHFFEVSKFLAMTAGNADAAPINVITFNGIVQLPEKFGRMKRMIGISYDLFGHPSNSYNGQLFDITILLTGQGSLVYPVEEDRYNYDAITVHDVHDEFSIGIRELHMGTKFFVMLYDDGTIKYSNLLRGENLQDELADDVFIYDYPSNKTFVNVAAVGDTFLLVDDTGDITIIGQGFTSLQAGPPYPINPDDELDPTHPSDELFDITYGEDDQMTYDKLGTDFIPPSNIRQIYTHTTYIQRDGNGYGDPHNKLETVILYITKNKELKVTSIVTRLSDSGYGFNDSIESGEFTVEVDHISHEVKTKMPTDVSVVAVAGSYRAAFAVTTAGDIVTWGEHDVRADSGFNPLFFTNVKNIQTTTDETIILLESGMIVSHYWNDSEKEGFWDVWGTSTSSYELQHSSRVIQVSTNENMTLVLHEDGNISVAFVGNLLTEIDPPSEYFESSSVVQVFAGSRRAAALLADGTLVYWGEFNAGQD